MRPDPPLAAGTVTRRDALAAGAALAAATIAPAVPAQAAAVPPSVSSPAARVNYICRWCGGNAVSRDAWASWDAGAQDWVLGATFDYAYCHECDGETTLEAVALTCSEQAADEQPGP